AMEEYPGLDIDSYLRKLDELAAGVQQRLPAQVGLEETLLTLNQFLFVEQGFSGDTDNYDDPRNNFLNEVLERKRVKLFTWRAAAGSESRSKVSPSRAISSSNSPPARVRWCWTPFPAAT